MSTAICTCDTTFECPAWTTCTAPSNGLGAHLRRLAGWFAERRRRAQAAELLHGFNAHQLRDLGMPQESERRARSTLERERYLWHRPLL